MSSYRSPSSVQVRYLTDYMRKHGVAPPVSNNATKRISRQPTIDEHAWERLAVSLNTLGPTHRSVSQWRKVFAIVTELAAEKTILYPYVHSTQSQTWTDIAFKERKSLRNAANPTANSAQPDEHQTAQSNFSTSSVREK